MVEETVNETTNNYRKLANIQLDKESGNIFVTDVDYFTYCDKVKELYNLYLDSIGNRQLETVADRFVSSLNAIKISARGYHFFVPKQYMGHIDELEDFMEELSNMNLYEPVNKSVRKEISINSMYVADDEKQRKKIKAIINQKTAAQDALDKAVRQAERYDGERKKVLKKLSSLEKEMDRLDRVLQAFQHAERLAAGDVQNSKIHQLRERLEKIDSEIHYAKNQLDFYREQSAKKGQELQKLFDELVRRILKADYSGSITTSAVDFTPQIQQGSAIAGAAVESLSFLLMDITSMLAASRGIGHHPGFLVHDSPREADLDIGPYHSLFTEMATLTKENGGKDSAPFQYIITTTTEPPAELNDLIRLSLAAYPEEMMLFRQRLRNMGALIGDAE